jgi:plastocyanin
MKQLVAVLMVLSVVTLFMVACSAGSRSSKKSSVSSCESRGTEVNMAEYGFMQPSVTIGKGCSLNLIANTRAAHIIRNGFWDSNGTATPATEPGAPTINVWVNGNASQSVGPFNTAGTYHLYCTVHPGMNLTVVVQ